MKFHDINGQITIPVFLFQRGLSLEALGAYSLISAVAEINIYEDDDLVKLLGVGLDVVTKIKHELESSNCINFSPPPELTEEEEELERERLRAITQDIAENNLNELS
ncbi:hypothetical protein LZS85_15740 [Aliivibrio fischeri]|uniref:hypothetical protein n=1 Tax=Aliivibrio fischeri TaxID=668 RepID=UPI001F389F3D|nr:hypothetical protein [Aliivibrio fischeri]MCE7567576.1 hypothetical protein [Aliivibrio fischeri]